MQHPVRPLPTTHVNLDQQAVNLEVRINDGSRPWVITHSFKQYKADGQWGTAQYLSKRYLASRPDQLQVVNVAAMADLISDALQEFERRDDYNGS